MTETLVATMLIEIAVAFGLEITDMSHTANEFDIMIKGVDGTFCKSWHHCEPQQFQNMLYLTFSTLAEQYNANNS